MTTTTNEKGWVAEQLKRAQTKAEKRLGAGWALLSPEMKEAFLAVEVLAVIAGADESAKLAPRVELAVAALSVRES